MALSSSSAFSIVPSALRASFGHHSPSASVSSSFSATCSYVQHGVRSEQRPFLAGHDTSMSAAWLGGPWSGDCAPAAALKILPGGNSGKARDASAASAAAAAAVSSTQRRATTKKVTSLFACCCCCRLFVLSYCFKYSSAVASCILPNPTFFMHVPSTQTEQAVCYSYGTGYMYCCTTCTAMYARNSLRLIFSQPTLVRDYVSSTGTSWVPGTG